jgi:hypothetical protein
MRVPQCISKECTIKHGLSWSSQLGDLTAADDGWQRHNESDPRNTATSRGLSVPCGHGSRLNLHVYCDPCAQQHGGNRRRFCRDMGCIAPHPSGRHFWSFHPTEQLTLMCPTKCASGFADSYIARRDRSRQRMATSLRLSAIVADQLVTHVVLS